MGTIEEIMQNNIEQLQANSYPGRGIIVGMSPDALSLVQVYWIMGRSQNSQNRIFLEDDNGFVRTQAFNESKMSDPSLIIYFPVKYYQNQHIITNGDQTDTIFDYLTQKKSMADALMTRCYEPDEPNFTPRISALVDADNTHGAYQLSILKSLYNSEQMCCRHFYSYDKALAGVGHHIATYQADGDPLPSFNGEPREMPLYNNLAECADFYWNKLNEKNRVSLLVKFIDRSSKKTQLKIINRHN